MSRPLFSLPAAERREEVEQYVGHLVELVIDPLRNGDETIRKTVIGRLIAVAAPDVGTVADLAIVKPIDRYYYPRAYSLATVRSIRPVDA